jgi:putative (di)nucleoside polyphosphate hydrolase
MALFNDKGEVFIGERVDNPGAWQMPQGGIDPGEDIEEAVFRELGEEIGTTNAEILKIHDRKIRYSIPEPMLKKMNLWDGKYGGQEQTWVALRFTGDDSEINIFAYEPNEFKSWKWVSLSEILDLIVPFKRDTYLKVIEAFKEYSDLP